MHTLRHSRRTPWVTGSVLAVLVLAFSCAATAFAESGTDVLGAIRAELIPEGGTETAYGMRLELGLLPQFVGWWYTLVPDAEHDPRYVEALSGLVAPCCDDNPAYKCCCERDGGACNIIRSGKGLAAHLILDLDYAADTIQASVLQWLRFARADYYMAAALQERGYAPAQYGLTTTGSCYRGLCETPISAGGCGGMNDLIEPLLEGSQS